MTAVSTARVRFLFHCWLLLIAAAALCDEAAAQGSTCGTQDPGQVDPIPDAVVHSSMGNSIKLDWNPPNDDWDTDYYYIVSCPTCPTKQANTTDETYTFSDLTAATEYSFSIEAGRWDCSLSTPFDLPGKTALTNIPEPVHITDVAETSFRAHWAASPDAGVQYEVSCAGIVKETSALCTGLGSGAKIYVSVRPVKTGFPPANFIYGTALTKLFAIDASTAHYSSTETAISVSWTESSTAGVSYQLTCIQVDSGDVTDVASSSPSATCGSLRSGEAYNLSVTVKKNGSFDDVVTQLPNQLTQLFAIEASSAQFNASETAISVSWHPSNTSGVSYQLTCIQVGSGHVTDVASSSPSATCGSLQSGVAYNLSLAVKKEGGFDEAVTSLPTQLTKNRGRCPSEDWLQFSGFCYLLVKGSNGRTLTEAISDCLRRDSSAHLLWITTQAELNWVTDYSARKWRLREDYRAQCKNCRFQGDAAWTGLYRDEADGGKFKWLKDNSAVNVSVNWLIGPSQPPMNFGYLLDDSRELLWRTYQPEARQFHFCKAPMRDQQQSLRSDAALEAARENSAKSTSRCPSPAWTLLYRGHNNQLCFLRTYPGSFHRALKECRRWAPNSEMLPIRTLWRQLDRPVRYYHICRFGLPRVKSAIHLEMRRTAGQAMHLGASCLHCQNGLLLSSLLSGLLLQLMRLLPAG